MDTAAGNSTIEDRASALRREGEMEKEEMEKESMFEDHFDSPPNGFQFVLPYLDLLSLLNVEMVSRGFREAVKDPSVWMDLDVERLLCVKLSKEGLLKLVERADGLLKSLSLVDAYKITDGTLERIFECNPGLESIALIGCLELKVENLVRFVEAHSVRAREKGLRGIVEVCFHELRETISREHLLRLQEALKVSDSPPNDGVPLIARDSYCGNYHDHSMVSKIIDVELCPICNCDCASKTRCEKCGRCKINPDSNILLDEILSYSIDFLCRYCWLHTWSKCKGCCRPALFRRDKHLLKDR